MSDDDSGFGSFDSDRRCCCCGKSTVGSSAKQDLRKKHPTLTPASFDRCSPQDLLTLRAKFARFDPTILFVHRVCRRQAERICPSLQSHKQLLAQQSDDDESDTTSESAGSQAAGLFASAFFTWLFYLLRSQGGLS
jgi:hypothetical protein